jgi:hypothetical protein
MLVCNVSQLARRAAIAADVAEITAAVDATATGNIVFATLVDDPASVGDHVDAFLGQIIGEAASATATVNAGLTYAAAIAEAVTAAEVWSGSVPAIYSATVAETTAAVSAQDATVTAAAWRSAMLAGPQPIFVNDPRASREGNVDGIMVNL